MKLNNPGLLFLFLNNTDVCYLHALKSWNTDPKVGDGGLVSFSWLKTSHLLPLRAKNTYINK